MCDVFDDYDEYNDPVDDGRMDYDRWEEEQVFQDREGEEYDDDEMPDDGTGDCPTARDSGSCPGDCCGCIDPYCPEEL